MTSTRPRSSSLSSHALEHDACGVGFVANLHGQRTHELVLKGIEALIHLEHRGACGCDPESGDGAGVLVHIPHEFLSEACGGLRIKLPEPGRYGAGMVFLPPNPSYRKLGKSLLEHACRSAGLKVLGWRDVPVNERYCGRVSRSTRPHIAQAFVKPEREMTEDELERHLYLARKVA